MQYYKSNSDKFNNLRLIGGEHLVKNTKKIDNDKINQSKKDLYRPIVDIANENGFSCQSYQVVTSDGQILSLQRIPGSLEAEIEPEIRYENFANQSKHFDKPKKQPVLLQHGLEADMMQWVGNFPEVAPALVLARAGYDVWLGNNRGTRFSQKHTHLDPKSREYWVFDWEDMGTKDLPAFINFILKTTGFSKIAQIGHSQGTTQLLAGSSLMSEQFNSKISISVLLAPPISMKNNKNDFFRFLMSHSSAVLGILDRLKFWNILPYNQMGTSMGVMVCKMQNGQFCNQIMQLFSDLDPDLNSPERLNVFMSNMPSGASIYSFLHFGQLILLEKEGFRRYDQGEEGNNEKQGSAEPPDQDIGLIDFPVAVMQGSNDMLADPEDVAWTMAQLQNTLVFSKEYNLGHFSFAMAKDMSQFTQDVLMVLNAFE